jgi:Tfp pilus assembly protein PilF|tara:strand:- start:33 stop:629 length:597 start_codon:yes stop_codon:yes gene_type:complete
LTKRTPTLISFLVEKKELRLGFFAKIFVIILLSSTASGASQTQVLLDKLARAPSAEAAKKIVINIQEAWINSHKDLSEKQLMSQALSSMDNGNLTKAERELTELIQKNPDFVEAWNKRATVRFFNGDLAGSETDVFEVLSREPRHFGAISGLAMINVHVGALEEAVKAYEMLLDIHPHAKDAKRYLPHLKKKIGQHDL